jgi:hypothetical protein
MSETVIMNREDVEGTSVKSEFPSAVDEVWVPKILSHVKSAINELVELFLHNPYLHRVEHSLHCELYGLLVKSGELAQTQDYGNNIRPRRVQKEWPETIWRPSKI